MRFITMNLIAHDKHSTSQTVILLLYVKKMTKWDQIRKLKNQFFLKSSFYRIGKILSGRKYFTF